MTKLRAHYDAKLKAWVSEDGREWPHGTEAEVEIGAAPGGNVEAGDDWEIPPLPPPPENAPVHITGGPGISGKELAELARRLNRECGTAFPEPEDSPILARRLRESGR